MTYLEILKYSIINDIYKFNILNLKNYKFKANIVITYLNYNEYYN